MDNALAKTPLEGLKYIKRIRHLLKPLADSGTERDKAGNRKLQFDQYAGLVLLSLFNPHRRSMRLMSDMSGLKKVIQILGGERASIGSLSESVRVFEPELLEAIIRQLLDELPKGHPGPGPDRTIPDIIPPDLLRQLVAVDGSALRALPQIVNAMGLDENGKWRMHLQFEVLSGRPFAMDIRADETGGENDERNVLADKLQAGVTYIADRGYERYKLFEQIVLAGANYVIRCQSRPVEVVEDRTLTEEAKAARILSDQIVVLGKSRKEISPVTHKVRRIVIQGRGQSQPRSGRKNSDEIILLTNLVDVPAEVIAAIYTMRWVIELFFRFLKQLFGCSRLVSHKSEGVAIQIYCALIACLLLANVTGRKVSRRAFHQFCLYFDGWADEDELLEMLARTRAEEDAAAARKNR